MILTLIAFGLYASTACRTIYPGDSPELVTAAWTFGIPHPPGYPLYTMVTGILARALPVHSPAFAANLTSACYGSLAVGLLFLFVRRLGLWVVAGVLAAECLALGATFWSQCLAAEVYTLDLLLLFAVLHAAASVVWRGTAGSWWLLGLGVGLWIGHRLLNLAYLPAVLVLVWALGRERAWRPRGRHMAALAAGLCLSLLPLLFLPLASRTDPYLDTGNPESLAGFRWMVTAEDYRRHLAAGGADLVLGRVGRFFASMPVEVGLAGLFSLLGIAVLVRQRGSGRRLLAALLFLFLANVGLSSLYNVLDVHVFYLPSWCVLALLAAIGADALPRWGSPGRHGLRRVAVSAAALAAGLAVLPLNAPSHNLRRHHFCERLARDTLSSVAPGSVLFARGDTTEPGLWYLQAVERTDRDVILVDPIQLVEFPWYLESVQGRHPEIDWPAVPPGTPHARHAASMLSHLVQTRPAYFMYTVAPDAVLPREEWSQYRLIPRGLTLELCPRSRSLDLDAQETWTMDFFARALVELRPIQPDVDLATQYIYGYYARSLSQAAKFLQKQQRSGSALRLYREVLTLEPDRYEQERSIAYRATGFPAPLEKLGARARAAIATLERGE